MRAFLAIPIAEPALRGVQALLEELRGQVSGVRWAPGDRLHITLRFFANLEVARLDDVMAIVTPQALSTQAFGLQLCGGGAFPSWQRPRVLWMGMGEGADALVDLARRSAEALHRAGYGPPVDVLHPHCTLGRPREQWPDAARRACRAMLSEATASPFLVTRMVLFESVLKDRSLIHVPRRSLPLGSEQ